MFDDHDHEFATVVLNASLTLMSIFVAVIAFLAIEYKGVRTYGGEPIRNAIVATAGVSGFAGVLALVALIQLRLRRWSTLPLALAFGVLIAIMTMGIVYVVFALMA